MLPSAISRAVVVATGGRACSQPACGYRNHWSERGDVSVSTPLAMPNVNCGNLNVRKDVCHAVRDCTSAAPLPTGQVKLAERIRRRRGH
jgi:hypothetical protein